MSVQVDFSDCIEIKAKFATQGACGHAIRKGDRIGWSRSPKYTYCADCWAGRHDDQEQAEPFELQHTYCCDDGP